MGLGGQLRRVERRRLIQRVLELSPRRRELTLVKGQHPFQQQHAQPRPARFGAGGRHLAQVDVELAAARIRLRGGIGVVAQRGDSLAVVGQRRVIAAEDEVGLGRLAVGLGGVGVVQIPLQPGHARRHPLGVALQQVELVLDEPQLPVVGCGQPGGREAAENCLRRAALAAPNLQVAMGKPDVDGSQSVAGLRVVVGGGGVVAAQGTQAGRLGVGGFALLRRQRLVDQPAEVGLHTDLIGRGLHHVPLKQPLIGRSASDHVERSRPA